MPSPVRQNHALLIGINAYPHFDPESTLKGAVHDAEAMAAVLETRFGFTAPRLLRNQEATRDGILQAMGSLLARVQDEDRVVFFFSGHGSQMTDREDDEPDGLDETLVPYDSGRAPYPNRDLSDDEIYLWLLELAQRTPYITVIVDACHSGTVLRDGFGLKARRVEPDLRHKNALPESPVDAERLLQALGNQGKGKSNWLPVSERYTLLAACRDEERAYEVPMAGGQVQRGALTFFLCQELMAAAAGATFREVYERVVTRFMPLAFEQHPQLEGVRDRELFGVKTQEPMRFFPVLERTGELAVVGAGAALGWAAGSELAVYPAGTRQIATGVPALGRLRLDEVGAVTARARVLDEASSGAIEYGGRAVLTAHSYGEMRLLVELVAANRRTAAEDLAQRISESPLLRLAGEGERGQVRLYLLDPRRQVKAQDAVPQLGPLTAPTWAAVGEEGFLILPPIPCSAIAAGPRIVELLERRARYLHVLQIENHDPESVLVEFLRQQPADVWSEVEPDAEGIVTAEEGDRFGLRVRNNSDQAVHVHVLDLDSSGQIELLYPVPGSQESLRAHGQLEIGMRPGETPLVASWPDGFPCDPTRPVAVANGWLKIFATTHPTDFSPLAQRDYERAFDPKTPSGSTPLGRLLRLALTGRGERGLCHFADGRAEDWTALKRPFQVRRKA